MSMKIFIHKNRSVKVIEEKAGVLIEYFFNDILINYYRVPYFSKNQKKIIFRFLKENDQV